MCDLGQGLVDEGRKDTEIRHIQNMMNKMNMTYEMATDILEISEEDKIKYKKFVVESE